MLVLYMTTGKTEWKDKPREPLTAPKSETTLTEETKDGKTTTTFRKGPVRTPEELKAEEEAKEAAEKEEAAKIEKVMAAIQAIADNSEMELAEINQILYQARMEKLKPVVQVEMLDGDAYNGPFYSITRIGKEDPDVYAIKLPMLTKLTAVAEGAEKEEPGTIYAKEGDFMVLDDDGAKRLVPHDAFVNNFSWVPRGWKSDKFSTLDTGDMARRIQRATKLEEKATTRILPKLSKIYTEAWRIPVITRLEHGKVTIDPPVAQEHLTIIKPPEKKQDEPMQEMWSITISRFNNEYMMVTDDHGRQFPDLQGKVNLTLPKIIDFIKDVEGLEVFGEFAYDTKHLDNFVRAFLKHKGNVFSHTNKPEWQFMFRGLSSLYEYIQHPERLIEERKPMERPQRRRKGMSPAAQQARGHHMKKEKLIKPAEEPPVSQEG